MTASVTRPQIAGMDEPNAEKPKRKRRPGLKSRITKLQKTTFWVLIAAVFGLIIALGAAVDALQKIRTLFPQASADVSEIEPAAPVTTSGGPPDEKRWSAPRLVPPSLVATSRKW